MLRVCERFGWTWEYVRAIEPVLLTVMYAFDDIRQAEDFRASKR